MDNVTDQRAAGSTYEDFMGRWSRQLAPKFISWLQALDGLHWLDVGCGTGALTDTICQLAAPASVVGCDPAAPFVEYARQHLQDARATFVVAGVGALPTRPGGFGSVTCSLALNFFPNPESAVAEMRDLAISGGRVSACVWDYAGRMDFLRYFWDAASNIDANAHRLDEGQRFPICQPDVLEALLRQAGLRSVGCEPIEIVTAFADFNAYWQPFLGGAGPAPSYVAALDEARRATLASELERMLPRQADGSIALVARAWAVRGLAI